MTTTRRRFSFTLVRLALADLRHEWILTTCMVLALAAILAPLLLLLGLKSGTIETLRNRLVENPVFRELRPQQTNRLPMSWFETMSSRADVAFVIPSILRGSSIVRLGKKKRGAFEGLDLVPTGTGDPLLVNNATAIPSSGEIVLSAEAAARTRLSAGDIAFVRASRIFKGRRQVALAKTTVKAVLPPGADGLPRVYAPLALSVDVESWREGSAIPNRGWSGSRPIPYLSFDGAFILSQKTISPILLQRLALGTGFAQLSEPGAEAFGQLFGFAPPDDFHIWQVAVIKQPALLGSIKAVRGKLRGQGAIILPFVKLGSMTIGSVNGSTATVRIAGLSPRKDELAFIAVQPDWPAFSLRNPISGKNSYKIQLPAKTMDSLGISIGSTIVLSIKAPDGSAGDTASKLPLTVAGQSIGKFALIPMALAARLRTATQRRTIYDKSSKTLSLARASYRGFRMYARSIDDVAGLYRVLREQGINTTAKTESIERVRVLDRGLTRIFWLVAIVGILGGFAALISSLYAAVERKKRDISLLRLMGLTRRDVFRFPVYQAASLTLLGALVAVGTFYTLAYIINTVFSEDLALGEKICHLPPQVLISAAVLAVLGGIISAIMAAIRATAIEPAEAIRVE
jgi:putative ABC transport system permease protein